MSRRGAILQDYGGHITPQPQDAQLAAANYYQRDKEQANQMQQQKQAAKAKEQGDATDYITGLSVPDIGDNTVDLYNDAQMKALQDKLMGMAQNGAGVNEIKMAAMPELQKIGQGYTIAKNEYAKITEAQKNLLKDFPKGNAEKARNMMGKSMLDNIFERDEKGNTKGYKDPSLINSNKSYSDVLFDFENMDEWMPDTDEALVANIQKTRSTVPLEGQLKIINPRGGYTDKKYKGDISIYHRPDINEDKKVTGIQLDSETVALGKNPDGTANIIQVMPKEKYEVLRGDEKSSMQFDRKLYKHLKNELGINPKSLDPQALDVYARNYALNYLEKTKLHGGSYNQFDVEKADPAPKSITNNNIRVGGGESTAIDVYTPIKEMFQDPNRTEITTDEGKKIKIVPAYGLTDIQLGVILPKAKLLGGEDMSVQNTYVRESEDGKLIIYKAANPQKVSIKNDIRLGELTKTGTNTTANQPYGVNPKNKAKDEGDIGGKGTKPTAGKTETPKIVKVAGL